MSERGRESDRGREGGREGGREKEGEGREERSREGGRGGKIKELELETVINSDIYNVISTSHSYYK